jgi:hypothetical protein
MECLLQHADILFKGVFSHFLCCNHFSMLRRSMSFSAHWAASERHSESQFVGGLSNVWSVFSLMIFGHRPKSRMSVAMTKTDKNEEPSGRSQPPRRATSRKKIDQAAKKGLKALPSKSSAAKTILKKTQWDLFLLCFFLSADLSFFPSFRCSTTTKEVLAVVETVLSSPNIAAVLNMQAPARLFLLLCVLLSSPSIIVRCSASALISKPCCSFSFCCQQ